MVFSKKFLRISFACTAVFFSGAVFTAFAGQDIRFSDSWKFYRGAPSGTPSAKTYSDASWQTVYLPHTDSVLLNYYSSYYYVGVSWYRKSFSTASYQGKKIFLELEAAMQTDTVYLNGTQISTHVVGYTPHVMDITGYVRFDSLNVLAVKLNNTYSTTFP
jgi:beta-galactosidase